MCLTPTLDRYLCPRFLEMKTKRRRRWSRCSGRTRCRSCHRAGSPPHTGTQSGAGRRERHRWRLRRHTVAVDQASARVIPVR